MTAYPPRLFASLPLADGSSPTETAWQRVDRRRTDCARYLACLNHAAGLNWSGFECSECAVSERTARAPREAQYVEAGRLVVRARA